MPGLTTVAKALLMFTLGKVPPPSEEGYQNISTVFRYNVGLDMLNVKLQRIKKSVSQLNVTVSDSQMLHDLTSFNEEFEINSKESSHESLYEYGQAYLEGVKGIYLESEKNYVSSYDIFLESFFSSTNNFGYKRYIDTPFSEFTRSDLLNQLQSFNLKKELLDSFKKINYAKYSDQALYLFYISTSSSSPPTSFSEVESKLKNIESFCKNNMPTMKDLNYTFDSSMMDEVNKIDKECDMGIEMLTGIQDSNSNDDRNIHIQPAKDVEKHLTLPGA